MLAWDIQFWKPQFFTAFRVIKRIQIRFANRLTFFATLLVFSSGRGHDNQFRYFKDSIFWVSKFLCLFLECSLTIGKSFSIHVLAYWQKRSDAKDDKGEIVMPENEHRLKKTTSEILRYWPFEVQRQFWRDKHSDARNNNVYFITNFVNLTRHL